MLLHSLDDDVPLTVLSVSDVYTVLAVATVSRGLRTLALAKVWLALVADLTARCLMDPLPSEMLVTCSALDLISEVRRLVCGPATWAGGSSVPAVLRMRSIHLHVDIPKPKAKLLPGGRYIAVKPAMLMVHGHIIISCRESDFSYAPVLETYALGSFNGYWSPTTHLDPHNIISSN
ncbi:hypothetical protein DFH09DRAFT_1317583 [Mycena vulgaris]|nr:hypothetical protein DFH09DRAFT_1317583 [Mycena vulgaris]